MSSILKVDTIQDQSGNNIINENADTITIGASGDTITIPSGATLANNGTVTGIPASAIDSGTIATARLGSGTASSSTFLRGDQTYAAAGLSGWSEDGANNNLLPASASAGIYLGVSSATAANLLDDYEEGTWSPVINGVTFSNVGFYTKIGRMCSVHFGNQTGASIALTIGNDYAITGLPFSMIGSNWESGSTQSASFADASAGYNSYPLTGRQTDGNAIEICNRSPVDVTSSDPLNVAMVYTTA
jgi:hypothetical protein